MNFEITKNNSALRAIEGKKEIIFSVVLFITFFVIVGYCMSSVVVTKESLPDYAAMSVNPYDKYEEMMSGVGIKNLVENEQFKEYKYNDKLDAFIEQSSPTKKENIFSKRE